MYFLLSFLICCCFIKLFFLLFAVLLAFSLILFLTFFIFSIHSVFSLCPLFVSFYPSHIFYIPFAFFIVLLLSLSYLFYPLRNLPFSPILNLIFHKYPYTHPLSHHHSQSLMLTLTLLSLSLSSSSSLPISPSYAQQITSFSLFFLLSSNPSYLLPSNYLILSLSLSFVPQA